MLPNLLFSSPQIRLMSLPAWFWNFQNFRQTELSAQELYLTPPGSEKFWRNSWAISRRNPFMPMFWASTAILLWFPGRPPADVGGARIEDFEKSFNKKLSAKDKEKIAHDVIDAGFKIYRGKKATYYGIASSLVKIITAIAHNTKEILTVSTRHKDVEGIKDVCLSLPTIIDKDGAHNAFVPSLSDEEKSKLKESAEIMDKANKEALTFL